MIARVAGLRAKGFPTSDLPLASMVHGSRLGPKGFSAVHHLYPDRALPALGVLWTWVAEHEDPTLRQALKFWVEQAFWGSVMDESL